MISNFGGVVLRTNHTYRKVQDNILFLMAILAFILPSGHSRTVSSVSKSVCDAVQIVSREGWNARPAWRYYRMKTPVNHVIIQHTETPFCRTHFQCVRWIQSIQDYHMMELSWWDLGYNFMVGGDGRIYEVRGWTRVGAHSINFNYDSIGIGFIGDYRKGHDEPTQEMLNATLMFIACGVEKGYLTPTREIHGHRDVRCTDSPGDNLYKKILRWDNYKGGRIKNYNCRTKKEKDYDV